MSYTGCKNWKPKKCTMCGFYLSSCFDPIKFDSKEELDIFYEKIKLNFR